jgi:hypothetical protein
MINQAVAPKVQTKSLPQGTNRAIASKPSCNAVKKEAIPIKRSKKSLEKSFGAFSEDLKKITDSKEYLDKGLAKTDHHMSRVKKEISENANLLLLHKGLVRHLKQLQIDRHPVLSKTKNVYKLKKKYENIPIPSTIFAIPLVN